MTLPFLHVDSPFPNPLNALDDPNGLLAIGADLSPKRLIDAYQHGIFPWFNDDDPLLWWSPDPRAIIEPDDLYISKSMRKLIRQHKFTITVNHAFSDVIAHCALPRKSESGTWINEEMNEAYIELHHLGHAHSIEVWDKNQLIGGLYGVAVGGLFCGESMFHQAPNASKLALIALCQHFTFNGGKLIDCQLSNPHLTQMGASTINRQSFLARLHNLKKIEVEAQCWKTQTITINL